jgi:hypothetical protein
MDDPQTTIAAAHTVWDTLITVGGLIVAFFTKRVVDSVDKKADQCDVDELKQDFKDWMKAQAEQHNANSRRLDTIIDRVSGNRSF